MICEYKTGKDVEVNIHVVTRSTVLALALNNRTSRTYRGADKSLARPTSHCILFDG